MAASKNTKKIKAAILGFGGMGHCHASQYGNQKDVELVALCDIDPKQLEKDNITINLGNSGKTETGKFRKYLSYEELIKNEPDLDYIDICLPSYMHAEYAIRAMNDGFHVLCEKPMALNTKDADKMIRVSEKTGKFLMIAQCLRFSEAFCAVEKAVKSGKYGKLLRLSLHRVGGFPGRWYSNVKLSGGALMDLHIHDIDFIQHLLGKPDSLSCRGVTITSGGIDDMMVSLKYKDGPQVCAESSWARTGFSGCLAAMFEKASMEIGDGVSLYVYGKPTVKVKLPDKGNPYFHEIEYFAACVKKNKRPETCSMESTRETIRLIELELKSVAQDGKSLKV